MTADREHGGRGVGPWLAWAWLGLIAGPACQLQQRELWSGLAYAALAAAALALAVLVALRRSRRMRWTRSWPVLLAAAALAFSAAARPGRPRHRADRRGRRDAAAQ